MERWAASRLALRDRRPELMDQFELNEAEHRHALDGLCSVNVISRSSSILWSAVRRLAIDLKTDSLRVLDLACGGGDVGVGLVLKARRYGVGISLLGCDRSPVAVAVARDRADRSGVRAEFIESDVLDGELPRDVDVVTCSLFLHHLDDADAVRLLGRMAASARHLVLVSDLVRSRLGYLLAWWGCRLLTRSHVVRVDGPLSVRAAFSVPEVQSMARAARLDDALITRHWPQRFALEWRRRWP